MTLPKIPIMSWNYSEWIGENIQDAHLACADATERMQAAFPELTRVRGHYVCPLQGSRPHWWLKTEAGEIVDPTAAQFILLGGEYIEHVEGSPEPTGKCLYCGEYSYGHRLVCSDECERQLVNA